MFVVNWRTTNEPPLATKGQTVFHIQDYSKAGVVPSCSITTRAKERVYLRDTRCQLSILSSTSKYR